MEHSSQEPQEPALVAKSSADDSQSQPQAPAPSEDLIDFGQNEVPQSKKEPGATETDHAHGIKTELPIRANPSPGSASKKAPETSKGVPTIVRQNSQTEEVDEFVDAES